jgi:hypothetical protein
VPQLLRDPELDQGFGESAFPKTAGAGEEMLVGARSSDSGGGKDSEK